MRIPMREKYVDEAVGVFIEFGTRPDGTVDVSNGNRDVFEGIPKNVAAGVIEAQERFRTELYRLLCGAPYAGKHGNPAVSFNTAAYKFKFNVRDRIARPGSGIIGTVIARVYSADSGNPMYDIKWTGPTMLSMPNRTLEHATYIDEGHRFAAVAGS